jgi:orotate phosphoribosyltransferase
MSTRQTLIDAVKAKAVVHGRVTLASGREADYYVDMRRVTLDGVVAPLIGVAMRELTSDWKYDAVGGLTLGADPVALAMVHCAATTGEHVDGFVVRKESKAHGMQRQIEGPDIAGRRVLLVEDTSTTGGSVLQALRAVQECGGIPVGVAVVVDRGTGAQERIEAEGFEYRYALGLDDLGLPAAH